MGLIVSLIFALVSARQVVNNWWSIVSNLFGSLLVFKGVGQMPCLDLFVVRSNPLCSSPGWRGVSQSGAGAPFHLSRDGMTIAPFWSALSGNWASTVVSEIGWGCLICSVFWLLIAPLQPCWSSITSHRQFSRETARGLRVHREVDSLYLTL